MKIPNYIHAVLVNHLNILLECQGKNNNEFVARKIRIVKEFLKENQTEDQNGWENET